MPTLRVCRKHLFVFSGDSLLLNCNIMYNARTTPPDGYSECGYTKATSDTCTSFTKTLNHCTLRGTAPSVQCSVVRVVTKNINITSNKDRPFLSYNQGQLFNK